MNDFEREKFKNSLAQGSDQKCVKSALDFLMTTAKYKYSYNFTWLGRPAVQLPNDAWALQELIWQIKPDLIIETGIAHGGSLVFSASQLAQLDICDAIEAGTMLDPKNSKRKVWCPGNNPKTAVREYLKAIPNLKSTNRLITNR